MFKQYDVITTKRVVTGEWGTLRTGSKGTIVEVYKSGQKTGYEVEFVTPSGRTIALVTLSAKDIQPSVKMSARRGPVLAKEKVSSASSKRVAKPKSDSKLDRMPTASKKKVAISKKAGLSSAKASKRKSSVNK